MRKALTALAVCLWGIAVTNIWVALPPRAMAADLVVAATASVIAAICRLAERRRDDGQQMAVIADGMQLLARTLANVTQPAAEARKTLPLRRIQ